MRKPQVVIVGRPNVGKSSLVNRLAGKRIAVVEEHRGVTRDRKEVEIDWRGLTFDVVDTGGWLEAGDSLEQKVSEQADAALKSADLVLLVVDVATGMVDEDTHAARWALKSGRPIMLIANKVDDEAREYQAWEFLQLGAGDPVMISALHGRGAGDLLDAIVDKLQNVAPAEDNLDEDDDGALRVAIVGRPNVGKSTLFNQLIGEERSVVHDMPGTTRDAIDTVVQTDQGLIRFIDTAGLRRRAKTEVGLETFSALRSLDALDRADIAVLVIDTEMRDRTLGGVAEKLAFLGDAPVMKTTALSGKGVHKILPALSIAAADYTKRVPTGALNRAIRDLQMRQPAPTGKIRYAVQGATEPPTFTLFVSGRLPSTYMRYVERFLRERFELGFVPIRVRVREQ